MNPPPEHERDLADHPPSGGSRDKVEDAVRLLGSSDPVGVYRSVAALARGGHGALLQPFPYSPDLPFHQPQCVEVEPAQTSGDTLRLYGHAAYPAFDSHLVASMSSPSLDHLWTSVFHLLVGEGRNVAIVTNHGQIVDIALVVGAFTLAMCAEERSFGVLGEQIDINTLVPRCNLMLSKMVATTQVFGLPTPEVLQSVCRCFFSVPQTASRRRVKLDPQLARANNIVMREHLEERLALGGQVLAMAASGSQDISLAAGLVQKVRTTWRQRRGEDPGESPSLHLQPLYNGTINLMLTCEYVVPVAISLDSRHPACSVGGLTRVRDAEDCHHVMQWIAQAHQESTGISTVYHEHEDDLLTQVRAVLR